MVRSTLLCQLGLLLAALDQVASISAQLDGEAQLYAPDDGGLWTPATAEASYFESLQQQQREPAADHSQTRKVAIIGAGPSGTSAAYFLKRAQDQLVFANSSDNIDITIYERETRIGGRTAVTYPYDDDSQNPIELGASIFADVNLNLRRAVKEFQLETGAHTGLSGQMGIWDGQQFLFEGDQSSWWTSAKFFLRYGYSAITTEGIVKKQLSYFAGLYNPSFLHARSSAVSEEEGEGRQAEVNARAVNGCDDVRGPSAAKRWADDSDDDQRSPSRRRVSDSDKDGVMHHAPAGAHYLIARPPPVAHSRSPLQRSPKLEPPPRDWQARLESKSLVDSAVRV